MGKHSYLSQLNVIPAKAGIQVYSIIFLLLFSGFSSAEEIKLKLESQTPQEGMEIQVVSDLQIQQDSVQAIQESQTVVAPDKQDKKGPSILKTNNIDKSNIGVSATLPKTHIEAQKAGWKQKSVKTPEPIDKLVKEVPLEVKAKKQRQMLKMQKEQALLTSSTDAPKIVTVPECVVFYAVEGGNSPAVQNFKLSNGGSGELQYTLSANQSWFSIDKSSGSVTTGKDTINVRVNISGLTQAQSPYTGDITISDNNTTTEQKIVKVRLSIITPEVYAKAYAYDQNGNLVRRVTPNGDIIEYEYDKLNRLLHIYYPDGNTVSYAYNENGNRVSMTDKTGATLFVYNPLNQLEAVFFPNINPVIYTYDKSGNITQVKYPDQSTVDYKYNSDNKLTDVIDHTGTTTYTYYTDTGLLHTKALPNNVVTTYGYDPAKRITDVGNRGQGNVLISTYHYEYDPNGNILSCLETTPSGAKTTAYTYDKLNRLQTVTYPDERGKVTYEYDGAGNRTKMITPQGTTNYKYDADNRLLRAGKEIFFYDKAGNMIKRMTSTKTSTYKYDYDNRLIEYKDNTYTVTFEYGGDGRRVSKTVNGVKTNYVNDILRNPYQVILEADGNWSVQKVYRYGLDRLSQEEF